MLGFTVSNPSKIKQRMSAQIPVVIGHWAVIDYSFEEKTALDSSIEASFHQTPQANKFSADYARKTQNSQSHRNSKVQYIVPLSPM